ncbi:hypothetical protein NEIELOOT_01863 [Neisseria elongata subsp. glycolytica ATCC 29315]|uniref:Uncharacterized protein n=1 Tax=Neisseria elongata subsp. glycolytica ATCC 29315 TaxID=546263 RepID=D4DS21_NEIEG|nr:hypothetical protein NEIELOOT_01863 [Neisseria elongata subsp. glycolytica ATCC 29315]
MLRLPHQTIRQPFYRTSIGNILADCLSAAIMATSTKNMDFCQEKSIFFTLNSHTLYKVIDFN